MKLKPFSRDFCSSTEVLTSSYEISKDCLFLNDRGESSFTISGELMESLASMGDLEYTALRCESVGDTGLDIVEARRFSSIMMRYFAFCKIPPVA